MTLPPATEPPAPKAAAATPKPVGNNYFDTTVAPEGSDASSSESTEARTAADGSGGVRIVFIIGVDEVERFESAKSSVQQLSVGTPMLIAQFITVLDQQLAVAGREASGLQGSDIVVQAPRVEKTKAIEEGILGPVGGTK